MSNSNEEGAKLVSIGGSPIYRHAQEAAWQPASDGEFAEAVSDHIARHLGPVATVFHELASDTVHIDVHFVMPTERFPFVRIATSGMSDLPMTTPPGADVPRRAELFMTLPPHWKLDQKSFEDEAWYWPVRLIKTLARLPHKYGTWLGYGHTIPNGDPPQRYAPTTNLSGSILLPSVTAPRSFNELNIDGRTKIAFYAVLPLYEGEMNLKLQSGTAELRRRFEKNGVDDVVVLSRKDVSRRWFGIF